MKLRTSVAAVSGFIWRGRQRGFMAGTLLSNQSPDAEAHSPSGFRSRTRWIGLSRPSTPGRGPVTPGGLAGRDEEVADLKGATLVRGKRRPPGWIVSEVGLGIFADDLDENLGNDPTADFAQTVAATMDGRLSQDVEPERRFAAPVT